MKKLGCILLSMLLIVSGCAKERVITLDADTITVNVHEELSDEKILSYVKCDRLACPEDLVFDIYKNDLDLEKIGSYTIDVMVEGSGYPLLIKVVDKVAPVITVANFDVNQYESIVWDRAMLDKINFTVSDNATDVEKLYENLKVSDIDTNLVGAQEITFSVKDASGNLVEQSVSVNVIAKPVVVVPPVLPPVIEPAPIEPVEPEPVAPVEPEPSEPEPSEPTEPVEPVEPEPTEPGEEEEVNTKITKMTGKDLLTVLSTSNQYEVVYISQTWCSHCIAFIKTLNTYLDARENIKVLELVLDLEPTEDIKEVDEEGNETVKVIYPDFELMKKTYEMDFVGTPSLYIFKDKKVVGSLIGNESMENLTLLLDEIEN